MKLAELNPMIHGGINWRPSELLFDCPLHPGERIYVHIRMPGQVVKVESPEGLKDISNLCWEWTATLLDWSDFNLRPSIQNHHHGKKDCNFHCSIVNGEILP